MTSPTNIGGMLWSTVVARELGLISRGEATVRLIRTLQTIDRMPRHEPSGMYYNWYSPATAAKLTAWPVGGGGRTRSCPASTTAGSGPRSAW